MKKFEYKILTINRTGTKMLDTMNSFGAEGWELVSVDNHDITSMLVFKREVCKIERIDS